ncbi:hypothetical protein TWF481_003005 [Arthrobotrys musiformis]|uniref:Uncharacterized protein n=1 Tax=Arthrobotrys musiformis TaxID=47236 RepID=A0AAV9VS21_9PEZI
MSGKGATRSRSHEDNKIFGDRDNVVETMKILLQATGCNANFWKGTRTVTILARSKINIATKSHS